MRWSCVAEQDNSNDFTGGRDSLGPIAGHTPEEEHSARLTVAEMAERWRYRHSNNKQRRRTAQSVVLEALGLVGEEGQPQLKPEVAKRVEQFANGSGQSTRFGAFTD